MTSGTLDEIALRFKEHGLLAGGTQWGKSTLAWPHLIGWYARHYPRARILIADSKPRFRAEWQLNGMSAAHRYRHWDHEKCPLIPGSCLLDLDAWPDFGLSNAWKFGHRFVIAQSDKPHRHPLILWAIDRFYEQARVSRPQLLYTDETLDFYSRAGTPLGGAPDAIRRAVRGGLEKGLSWLGAVQRVKGIPLQLVSEIRKLYLFQLDISSDIKYLADMGLPPGFSVPPLLMDEHDEPVKGIFRYFNKGSRKQGLYRLRLPAARIVTARV